MLPLFPDVIPRICLIHCSGFSGTRGKGGGRRRSGRFRSRMPVLCVGRARSALDERKWESGWVICYRRRDHRRIRVLHWLERGH